MGHKILQDHANVFCQMFVGWRMGDDLKTLCSLHDGTLTIDILTGNCTHDSEGRVDLHVAGELSAWFHSRLEVHGVDETTIESATLNVVFTKNEFENKYRRCAMFNWNCQSRIIADGRTYEASLCEPRTWIEAS